VTPLACDHCGQRCSDDSDDDPCIEGLPGVLNACCGHGDEREAYVQMRDGTWVGGSDALVVIRYLQRL
jgi:hypothetical protein